MNKRNVLIASIRIATILVIVLPHGTIYQILDVNDKRERNIKQSPYKQICCLCNRPATHKVYYKPKNAGITKIPYYFCDDHYPPPGVIEGKGRGRASENFDSTLVIIIFLIIYFFITLQTIIYLMNKDEKLKPTLRGAVFGFIFAAAVLWYYNTL